MWGEYFMKYDVIIIGAGPGGIFSAYELMKKAPDLKVAVFEEGNTLEKRKCPIDGKNIKSCIKCPTCAIMNGFGGAGAFLMANTTLLMTLVVLFTNISARKKLLAL